MGVYPQVRVYPNMGVYPHVRVSPQMGVLPHNGGILHTDVYPISPWLGEFTSRCWDTRRFGYTPMWAYTRRWRYTAKRCMHPYASIPP